MSAHDPDVPVSDGSDVPRQLPLSLLLLRVGIVVFLAPWIYDKFHNPGHAIGVFEHFYGLGGIAEPLVYAIGALQVLLLACFAFGIARRWSYGLVLLMHAGSTLSSWPQYMDPYNGANLLFFAAWPALAACIALYLLRDHDRMLSLGKQDAWEWRCRERTRRPASDGV